MGRIAMTRRRFIKNTGVTTLGAAAVAGSEGAQVRASQTRKNQKKPRTPRRKVLTEAAPKPVGPYSQAIVAGNTIYVAGQGPINPRTGKIDAATFEDQAIQTFENVKAILEAAGATLANVARVNVYLADLKDFSKMNEVYRRYFSGDYPARTTVGTQLLLNMLIEVDCVAVV
jgi:2-iminobutanoate/2-iminopropanoate deaminase